MGLPVLILGYSGTGKSASLRNFEADEVALVNVNGKPLPFRCNYSEAIATDDYTTILQFIQNCKSKIVVIDDTQYLLANEFMRRANERGFDKFTEIATKFWKLIMDVGQLPKDKIVYFLSHLDENDNGREKAKTIGKLLDDKITIEGMFTIVLKTIVEDGNYYFSTQNNGSDTVKSPIGLFSARLIDNDLKAVDEGIRDYFSIVPELEAVCENCQNPITPTNKYSVKKIVDLTVEKFGKQLCLGCAKNAKS